MTAFTSLVGQRVLVSVTDGEPQMTTIRAMSPQGQYTWLSAVSTLDCEIGWRHVSYVRVLEVFGGSTLTPDQNVAAMASASAPLLTTHITT